MKLAVRLTQLALTASLLFAASAHANEAVIRKALTQQFPGAQITSVKPTPYSGLFEVYLDDQLVYVDAKGQYVITGDVIDLKNRTNLTQARLNQLQAIKWDSLPFGNAIKVVKGNGARKLVVFSDVDCPYCRKFEAELSKVDNITVYTFLYPMKACIPRRSRCPSRSGAHPTATRHGTTTSRAVPCRTTTASAPTRSTPPSRSGRS